MRQLPGGRLPDIGGFLKAGGNPAAVPGPCGAARPPLGAGDLQPFRSRRDVEHDKPGAVLANDDRRSVRRHGCTHDTVELPVTFELSSALGVPNTGTAST